jgi:2-haloacid dehalogenase
MSKRPPAENAQRFPRSERWATFDCYGTLIDWNGGIRRELVRIFGEDRADEQLQRYHRLEPELQADGQRTYREVMAAALRELGAPAAAEGALARALPSWEPFAEVRHALEQARARGWKLGILSNTDRDFIEASMGRIGVPFELAIVASEIGSYKPATAHWQRFFELVEIPPERHVHVAQSHFHDIVPARELGLRTVWINRYRERHDPPPTRELRDLTRLAETLDDLAA